MREGKSARTTAWRARTDIFYWAGVRTQIVLDVLKTVRLSGGSSGCMG